MIPGSFIEGFCFEEGYSRQILVDKNDHECIGSGHFSNVYAHPDHEDRCIKVSFEQNDGGVMYAYFARQEHLQSYKGLPKIYDILQHKIGDRDVYFIEMKRYVANVTEYLQHVEYIEPYIVDESKETFWGKDLIRPDVKRVSMDLRDILKHGSESYEDLLMPSISMDYAPLLIEIRKFFHGRFDYDLHDQNIMFDENNDYVIIDPLSFKRSS